MKMATASTSSTTTRSNIKLAMYDKVVELTAIEDILNAKTDKEIKAKKHPLLVETDRYVN